MSIRCLLIVFVFAVACTGEHPSERNVLTREEMGRVLWDIMKVDEFATGFLARDSAINLDTGRMKLYQQVFEIHKVSKEKFSTSFKYYAGRPDIMKLIIDSLSVRAEREKRNAYLPKDSQLK